MKTYKLIKTYPGSFPLGKLAYEDKEISGVYNLDTTYKNKDYIENHPTHWEQVCPKCLNSIPTCKILNRCGTPLFVTEDKVDVYENDKFFFIASNWKSYLGKAIRNHKYSKWLHPIYSTKDAAENYIKMNKPCLSLQEVTELWYKLYNESMKVSYKGYYNELTKIVKQKLK